MRVEGNVPLDVVVWLTRSPDALIARAIAEAYPQATWTLQALDLARVRMRGTTVDVESPHGQRWTGLVMGRVVTDESAAAGEPLRPYALEPPAANLRLESCWFALDEQGHVACFDRDQLGAAPMKRCWGPRPEPPAQPLDLDALVSSLDGHHARERAPTRAFTFVANGAALVRELGRKPPPAVARRWALAVRGDDIVVTGAMRLTQGEQGDAVSPMFVTWLHARGLCRGCARSTLRDPRLAGLFVYEHRGRARAVPYERVAEPVVPWTAHEAVDALGLSLDALGRTALPLQYRAKDRLQPIEYAPCTWSDTVPWESESGERHNGASIRPR